MEKGKIERLTLPDADQLQRMLRLANELHSLPVAIRAEAALRGLAELITADAVAAWAGPANRLIAVGIAADSSAAVPIAALLPRAVGLLIGRRPTRSPIVRLHTDTATRAHEIRSVCAGDAGPSLLVARRSGLPFDQRQRTMVQLLHPQIQWALRPPAPPAEPTTTSATKPQLSAKQRVVLQLLLSGETEKQLANRLSKNAHTVHSRIKQIYRHFGVVSRAQLLAKFVDKSELQ